MIERESNIKMKQIERPSPAEIIEASSKDMLNSFQNVTETVLKGYQPMVKSLLENYTPEEALSRALALISGNEDGFGARSLITNEPNLITFELTGDFQFSRHPLLPFFKAFDDFAEIKETKPYKNIRKISNYEGFVFDVFEKKSHLFTSIVDELHDNNFDLKICESLPQLESGRNERRDDMRNRREDFEDRGGRNRRFGFEDRGGRNRDRYEDRGRRNDERGDKNRYEERGRRNDESGDRNRDRRMRINSHYDMMQTNKLVNRLISGFNGSSYNFKYNVGNFAQAKMLPLNINSFMRSRKFAVGLYSIAGAYYYLKNN